jgi:outer membrane biosynthesis protein TonB
VRSVRLLSQAPFPGLNAAAVLAVSQWQFDPGRINGEPVAVIFNLTIRFRVH